MWVAANAPFTYQGHPREARYHSFVEQEGADTDEYHSWQQEPEDDDVHRFGRVLDKNDRGLQTKKRRVHIAKLFCHYFSFAQTWYFCGKVQQTFMQPCRAIYFTDEVYSVATFGTTNHVKNRQKRSKCIITLRYILSSPVLRGSHFSEGPLSI